MNIALAVLVLGALALAALAYVAVCGAVAWRFTTARRAVVPALPAGARAVRFPARDGRAHIEAWYLHADKERGAVIFVHGKDACRGNELKSPTLALARSLVHAGLSVLMIDLRGHGSSSATRLTYGKRERFDVLGAVDWLHAQGHARVGVLSASMGASAALMAAAEEPAIAALVADSAFADFGRMVERQFRKLSGLPRFFLPGALAMARVLTGEDLRRARPIDDARALAGRPVLVIHSEGDRFVPVDDARAIAGAIGAELWTTATDRHIGSFVSDPTAYTQRMLDFFGRHLAVRTDAPLALHERLAA